MKTNEFSVRGARRRLSLLFLSALFAGCGSDSTGPDGPPGPDLTTIGGAMEAMREFYGKQEAANAISLLDPEYRFHPARPESIGFLAAGETFWDYEQEVEILNLLLVPERVNWLDQVLLEHRRLDTTYPLAPDSSVVEVLVKVDLALLVGADSFERSDSDIVYVYRRNSDGAFLLLEEREAEDALGGFTVGEQKARVIADP